ncbi:MAG: MEDS domain-containing protein [Chloroflexi bacterium]|nr:MEDS domain-containing protein [Chloroflexota bacterium]
MDSIYSGKRKSGISLVGDIPWGSHFGQFYQTKRDLLDILVPYFRAGLENNEFCVWVTSGVLSSTEAKRAMRETIPHFGKYLDDGQMQIIPRARSGKFEKAIASWLDNAVSGGFDGLRLACAFPWKKGSKAFATFEEGDAIARQNMIAVFTYPRDEFDAIGLMEVVKNHRFALVHNAGSWEVIESSEATIAKDALQRSEEKLRSLFSNMGEGFAYNRIVLDGRGTPCDFVFLEVNDAFERLTGLKREDIINRRVTEVLPGIEKDLTDLIGRYGKVALTGEPARFESYYAEPLNRWYSVSAFSPHKGFFGVTFSDITESKKIEETIRASEAELSAILESIPILTLVVDPERQVFKANTAAGKFSERTIEEMVGMRAGEALRCLYATDDPRGCGFGPNCQDCLTRSTIQDTFETGISHYNVETQRPFSGNGNGQAATFLLSTVRLETPRKQVLVCIEDITERKRREEEIKNLNKDLQRRATELETANKELEAFSYSVSHDLRAPLRSLDGFSQALLDDYADKVDDNAKDYLNRIRESSQLMGQLIDDLLLLSRVTRAEIQLYQVNLSDIARRVAEGLKHTQPDRNVDWIITPRLQAIGDNNLLRIVLENLLENAWKFTGKCRQARIEFSRTKVNGVPTFYVRDNGVGFDMQYVHKLFVPFQRLHSITEFPGTGIGLATVQRIINRLGGRVWAQGEVEKGATFYFTLNSLI